MKNLQELDFFERLFEEPQNELVEQAMEEGRIPIGYNYSMVPEVLLNTGNLFGLWMTAPSVEDTSQADCYLSQFACSYSKTLLESSLDGTYEFLGAMVSAPPCDSNRISGQYFDLLKLNGDNDKFFSYMMDSPRKIADYTVKWFTNEIKNLSQKFNEVYDANINDDTLIKSIKEFNEFNRLISSIGEMRKEDNPKITGTEWAKIYGACKIAPRYLLVEPLKKIKAEIEAREPELDLENKNKLRIMISGSVIDKPEYIEYIESQGAIVVADRYSFGSLPGMEEIKEDGDPFENIARYYLEKSQSPRMIENANSRIEYSKNLMKEYNAEGIIFETMSFCDLWKYEEETYVDEMRKSDIPIVSISREYNLTGEGQLGIRIQAFLESLKKRREE